MTSRRGRKRKASEHFRSAWSLETNPYPASGSHQLDAARLVEKLESEVVVPYETRDLFLVDLREETHGFLDGEPCRGTRTTISGTSDSHRP